MQKYRICLHRLATCYGIHEKTITVSIRPHSSVHSGGSSTWCPTLTCWPSMILSSRSLGGDWRRRPARWTDQLCNDTGSVPACLWRQAVLVEWRDFLRWLRDDDDANHSVVKVGQNAPELSFWVPQNRHLAFLGSKFTRFLPELCSEVLNPDSVGK